MGSYQPLFDNAVVTLTTTSAGAADGTSFIVSTAGQVDDFFNGMTAQLIAPLSSGMVPEQREITDYDSGTGTFIVDPAFTAQVATGTTFLIINGRPTANGGGVDPVVFNSTATGGTNITLIDSAIAAVDNKYNGLLLVMLSGNNIGISRWIKTWTLGTTTFALLNAFTSVVAAGDKYAVLYFNNAVPVANDTGNTLSSQVIGAKDDAAVFVASNTASLMAYIKGLVGGTAPSGFTKGATAASNFFAAPVFVIALTPNGPSYLSGVALSQNGFTAAAVLTYSIYKTINGTERLVLSFTRIVGSDPDGVIILDGPDVIDGTGVLVSWRVSVQSSAAGDNARTMAYQYNLQEA